MRAKKFQPGLQPSIRSCMSILQLISFLDVVETTRMVEHESEEVQRTHDNGKKIDGTKAPHQGYFTWDEN